MRERLKILTCLVFLPWAGCRNEPADSQAERAAAAPSLPTVQPVEPSDAPVVVYLGNSLAAGLGLPEDEAFPAQLDRLLRERGVVVRTVNAGVSGDTTAGGLSRLEWLLQLAPDVVVLELGANDALRGLPPEITENNLREIVALTLEAGAEVLLAGMKVPPNYGASYSRRFEEIYPRLAGEFELAFLPFLLEGVAGHPELNQSDGIHPNARGQKLVAENLLPLLESLLRDRGVSSRPNR